MPADGRERGSFLLLSFSFFHGIALFILSILLLFSPWRPIRDPELPQAISYHSRVTLFVSNA